MKRGKDSPYVSLGMLALMILPKGNENWRNKMKNEMYLNQRNVYGNVLYYPACPVAQTFCSITNTKTLSEHHLTKIKQLGYVLHLEVEPATKALFMGE